jgi:hypothetical protein
MSKNFDDFYGNAVKDPICYRCYREIRGPGSLPSTVEPCRCNGRVEPKVDYELESYFSQADRLALYLEKLHNPRYVAPLYHVIEDLPRKPTRARAIAMPEIRNVLSIRLTQFYIKAFKREKLFPMRDFSDSLSGYMFNVFYIREIRQISIEVDSERYPSSAFKQFKTQDIELGEIREVVNCLSLLAVEASNEVALARFKRDLAKNSLQELGIVKDVTMNHYANEVEKCYRIINYIIDIDHKRAKSIVINNNLLVNQYNASYSPGLISELLDKVIGSIYTDSDKSLFNEAKNSNKLELFVSTKKESITLVYSGCMQRYNIDPILSRGYSITLRLRDREQSIYTLIYQALIERAYQIAEPIALDKMVRSLAKEDLLKLGIYDGSSDMTSGLSFDNEPVL